MAQKYRKIKPRKTLQPGYPPPSLLDTTPAEEDIMIKPYIAAIALTAGLFLSPLPAQAAPPDPCDVMIVLFGEPVCREAFVPADTAFIDTLDVPDEQKTAMKDQIASRNRHRMEAVLWQKALENKFGAKAITPTDKEITEFSKALKSSMQTSYEADKDTVAYIREVLAAKKVDGENAAQLEAIMNQAENGIRFYEQRQKQTEALPEEYKFVADTAETEIARNMVNRWKSDKILYETYRGRLALGADGPQPIDAYAAMLKYIDENGKLEIMDLAYKEVFKEMREFAANNNEMIPGNGEINRNYFTSPTWQLTLSNNSKRVEDLKNWVESLNKKPENAAPDAAPHK
jgi:hypothetical protein